MAGTFNSSKYDKKKKHCRHPVKIAPSTKAKTHRTVEFYSYIQLLKILMKKLYLNYNSAVKLNWQEGSMNNYIAENIKNLRRQKNVTQEELRKRAND